MNFKNWYILQEEDQKEPNNNLDPSPENLDKTEPVKPDIKSTPIVKKQPEVKKQQIQKPVKKQVKKPVAKPEPVRKNEEIQEVITKRSKFIQKILYNKNTKKLIILFRDQKIYRYFDVPKTIGEWITNGQFAGQKFNKYIRHNDDIEYQRIY
jgi:hypothetical protein